MKNSHSISIAWFVTPHGFGHAARAAAIMDGIHAVNPTVTFEIFTAVPEFFFKESLQRGKFNYFRQVTDIGLAQKSSLQVDLPETIRRLDDFLPFEDELITALAAQVNEKNCRLIVCDIAPMGIAVAKAAGIPSVLVENFIWHWIYQEYESDHPGISPHIHYLRRLFQSADYHIQTEPVCQKTNRHLLTPPLSRMSRTKPHVTRKKLGVPEHAKMVIITMGGVPGKLPFIHRLAEYKDVCFVIPGSPSLSAGNIIGLDYNSGFFHPDLMAAADAVIGKPGYSTVAEVYHAGIPFGYVTRDNFRESAVMENFIQNEMSGFPITDTEFTEGTWLPRLHELLNIPRIHRENNGTGAAEFILNIASGGQGLFCPRRGA
ncbi:MAG: hypothetical protein GY950_27215 [bacterium]|nr:hypothetical protein [bacterium]